MRFATMFVFALLFILMPVVLMAQNPTIEEKVDSYLKPLLDEDLISGSVLIAKGNDVLLSKGYGPANREYNQPCRPDTRFRLASVSKQFTATAVMMLQDDGNLSITDTLSKYIPDYPRGNEITLHHLLNHTSGVVNYSRLDDHYRIWCMPHTIEQVIERFKHEPLDFNPGERWSYSNSGYVLLTYIIQKVSGLSFGDFLEQRIFKPLDMAHSGLDEHSKIIPLRATGHYNQGQGMIQAPYLDITYTSGAGGIYSTVEDLYKWDRALYTNKLLSEKAKTAMFTPGQAEYGYGWFITQAHGHKVIRHQGGINGFLTHIYRFVDDDVVVITLFNYVSTFARRVNQDLTAMALGLEVNPALIPDGVTVETAVLDSYAGEYELQPGYRLTASVENGRLYIASPGEEPEAGIAQNEFSFYLRGGNAVVQFIKDREGRPMMLLLQSEHMMRCPKVTS